MPSSPQPAAHPPARRLPRRLVTGLACAAALAVALTGCTDPGDGSPGASPSASSSESAVPSEGATAGPSVDPTASPSASASAANPIEKSCLELVSLQTMYDFDPNFGLIDPFTPAAGTRGADAAGYDGVACNWVQQTSGETLEIDVAAPPSSDLVAIKAKAGETADGRSYFSSEGTTGVVQVFDRGYWIVLSSTYFLAAPDAAALAESVTAGLP